MPSGLRSVVGRRSGPTLWAVTRLEPQEAANAVRAARSWTASAT